jgi:hypothetical protein
MSTTKCGCGSYAINKHRQEPTSSLNKCDVCYWKEKAESKTPSNGVTSESLYEVLKTEKFHDFFSGMMQFHLADIKGSPSKAVVLLKICELFKL